MPPKRASVPKAKKDEASSESKKDEVRSSESKKDEVRSSETSPSRKPRASSKVEKSVKEVVDKSPKRSKSEEKVSKRASITHVTRHQRVASPKKTHEKVTKTIEESPHDKFALKEVKKDLSQAFSVWQQRLKCYTRARLKLERKASKEKSKSKGKGDKKESSQTFEYTKDSTKIEFSCGKDSDGKSVDYEFSFDDLMNEMKNIFADNHKLGKQEGEANHISVPLTEEEKSEKVKKAMSECENGFKHYAQIVIDSINIIKIDKETKSRWILQLAKRLEAFYEENYRNKMEKIKKKKSSKKSEEIKQELKIQTLNFPHQQIYKFISKCCANNGIARLFRKRSKKSKDETEDESNMYTVTRETFLMIREENEDLDSFFNRCYDAVKRDISLYKKDKSGNTVLSKEIDPSVYLGMDKELLKCLCDSRVLLLPVYANGVIKRDHVLSLLHTYFSSHDLRRNDIELQEEEEYETEDESGTKVKKTRPKRTVMYKYGEDFLKIFYEDDQARCRPILQFWKGKGSLQDPDNYYYVDYESDKYEFSDTTLIDRLNEKRSEKMAEKMEKYEKALKLHKEDPSKPMPKLPKRPIDESIYEENCSPTDLVTLNSLLNFSIKDEDLIKQIPDESIRSKFEDDDMIKKYRLILEVMSPLLKAPKSVTKVDEYEKESVEEKKVAAKPAGKRGTRAKK